MSSACSCVDWNDNIPKVDAPLLFLNARNPGKWNYDGKMFVFCPWCGERLIEVQPDKSTQPTADTTASSTSESL